MKKLLVLVVLGVGVWFMLNRSSGDKELLPTKYHREAADRYVEAILKRDEVAAMFYSTGMAKQNGYTAIIGMLKAYPGQFTRYTMQLGGAPSGDRASGRAFMYGANGDMFCVLNFTLQRQNGYWLMSEVGTQRSK